jgi:hypothetical protein
VERVVVVEQWRVVVAEQWKAFHVVERRSAFQHMDMDSKKQRQTESERRAVMSVTVTSTDICVAFEPLIRAVDSSR